MAELDQLYDALRKADAAGNTEDAKKLSDYIRSQSAAPAPTTPEKRPEDVGTFEGAGAALKRGFESFGDIAAGYGVTGSRLFGTDEATAAKMAAAKAEAAKKPETPGMTVTDFERIAAEKGYLAAAKEAPKYILEQIAQSAPQMATPLAVGAAASPFITPVGGAIAGIATYGLQQFGNFMLRQAEEKNDPKELEIAKAALTAGGTAPLGYFADRFTLGLGSLGKNAGKETLKELAARRAAGEIGAGAVAKEVGKRAGMGAVEGVIAEAPTEVLESVAERYQAGLDLTGKDAMNEYKESFFGAAAAGGGLGAGAKGVSAYGDYRDETAGLKRQAEVGPPRRSAIDEATEYENTGSIAGGDQLGLSLSGEGGGADTGITGTTTGGMGGTSSDTGRVDARAEVLDNQLIELRNEQAKIARFDENDPRIGDLEETIKELQAERKATALNAPGQKRNFENVSAEDYKANFTYNIFDKNEGYEDFPKRYGVGTGEAGTEAYFDTLEEAKAYAAEQQKWMDNARLRSLKAVRRERGLNAPNQEGFEFGPADENTQRTLGSTEPTEFTLEAPEGKAEAVDIQPIEEEPRAQMMLVGAPDNPMKPMTAFFNSIKPKTVIPGQVQQYKDTVKNVLDTIAEFVGGKSTKEVKRFEGEEKGPDVSAPLAGPELDARLAFVRDFFDSLSIAPKERENLTSTLSQQMAGMDVDMQTAALEGLTSVPKLNTIRGINEFQEKLNAALGKFERKRIGQEETALPYRINEALAKMDPYVVGAISRALKALANIDPAKRTPEEKAAYAYFGPETGWSYVMAMRSAAFDLGTPENRLAGVTFKDQNKKQAELFKEWIADNLPNQEYKRFEATVKAYEKMTQKAEKAIKDAEKVKKEGDVASKYFQSIARAPSGKVGTSQIAWGRGPGKASTVTKLDPNLFYPMHPAVQERLEQNDLQGALKLLAKTPEKAASKSVKFAAKLAQKLLDMNLATTITMNKQEKLVQDLLDYNISTQRDELFKYLEVNYPEQYNKYFTDTTNVRLILDGLEALKGVNLDPVIGQFDEMLDEYIRAVGTLDAGGSYFPYIDTVNLNPNNGGFSDYTFLHEMTHAATAYSLDPRNWNKLTDQQKGAVTELKSLYEFARRTGLKDYAFTSLDEFVAEAFSNEKFQALLRSIPYKGSKEYLMQETVLAKKSKSFTEAYNRAKAEGKSSIVWDGVEYIVDFAGKGKTLWDKFTEYVAKLFGLDNVLGYTIANANVIFQAPPATTTEGSVLNARGRSARSVLGNTMPTNPGFMSFTDKVFGGRPMWGEIKDSMADLIENVNDTARQYYLGGFTLRQLNDMIGHRIPQFRSFIDKVEGMLDDRNRRLEEVKKITDRWMRWQDKNPKLAKTLNGLMLDSTLQGVDPSKGTTKIQKIDDAYLAIKDEGRAIYKQVRDYYSSSMQSYIDNIVENKKAQLRTTNNQNDPKYAAETKALEAHPDVKKVRDYFAKHKVEPYFPIRRFGRFSVQLLEGKRKEFYLFETAGERKAFLKTRIPQLEAELGRALSDDEVKPRNSIQKMVSENMKDFTFLTELKNIIAAGKGKDNAELKANLEESLEQLYFLTLPDQSIRKMFMNRKGTAGMDTDMLRAFASSAFHMSYQQSRYKFSRGLYDDIGLAKDDVRKKGAEGKVEAEYLVELDKRLEYIMNPTDTGAIPSFLSNTAFLWFMTAPASAIVNMIGVPAVGLPVVGAKFGNKKTFLKMWQYTKKFMSSGFKDVDGNAAFPSLNNKPQNFTKLEQAAYDQLVADGVIDITLSHDLVGMAEAPSNLYTGKSQTVMKYLSGAFHGAEKFNREIVAMSSFDLAYEQAKKDGYSDEAAFKKAVGIAKDLTYKSMFDYSTLNKPRYFQQPLMKVILQFKQFSQQMTYLLARSTYEAMHKNYTADELKDIRDRIRFDHTQNKPNLPPLTDAELNSATEQYIKDVRTEARDRLAGTLGMTAIFAGASGLPLYGMVAGVMNVMQAAFGDDEEEFDFDNWFKNWCNRTFGGFVGDSISRGVASQVLGADIGSRLGLNDMWYRDTRKSADEVSAVQNMMVNLLGPTAGLAINSAEALKQFNDGHIERSLETASPALIKNILKGIRLETEGRATTLRGNELIGDITHKEALTQMLGFSPERLAQRQKANIEMKTMEQKILTRRQTLLDGFFMSVDNGDDDMRDRILDKVVSFNQAHPGVAISSKNLSASVKTRFKMRAMAEATGGMAINKKLIGELQDMADWGNPE